MQRLRKFGIAVFVLLCAVTVGLWSAGKSYATVPGTNTLVSVDNTGDGYGGNDNSGWSNFGSGVILSKGGRLVAFNSKATNLVSGDTNGKQDVFTRDLNSNVTTLVSLSSSGVLANADSEVTAVSESGRYVVFRSTATNLIDGQTGSGTMTTYLRDTNTNTTTQLVVGVYSVVTAISNDGRFALVEEVNGNNHIYMDEISTGALTQLDVPYNSGTQQGVDSSHSVMSCDGSLVAFDSAATNFVSNDTNGKKDIFLVDTRMGTKVTDLTVSANDDSVNPTISCNGEYVGFSSKATNIVSGVSAGTDGHYFRYDRINGTFQQVDLENDGTNAAPNATMGYSGPSLQLDDRGNAIFRHVADLTQTSGTSEYFLRDMVAGTTELLTRNSGGTASAQNVYSGFLSADGKKASFTAQHYSGIFGSPTDNLDNVVVADTGL